MKCPACQDLQNKVVDSRLSRNGRAIRRRRECLSCGRRFTTYERIEEQMPMVVKKDGRREPFQRSKIMTGLKKAFQKRSISVTTIEDLSEEIEREFSERGDKEVDSSFIGERIMDRIRKIDEVAYVRFASVYRSFKDVTQFMQELEQLLEKKPPKDAQKRAQTRTNPNKPE
jgi:transcriptional repressor NrdR